MDGGCRLVAEEYWACMSKRPGKVLESLTYLTTLGKLPLQVLIIPNSKLGFHHSTFDRTQIHKTDSSNH